MMRRMLASLVRRAEAGDLFALESLGKLRRESGVALAQAARRAHDGPAGYSWAEIGAELGITRQAAQQLAGEPEGPGGH